MCGQGTDGEDITHALSACLVEQCSPTLGCGQRGRAAVWGRLEEMTLKISPSDWKIQTLQSTSSPIVGLTDSLLGKLVVQAVFWILLRLSTGIDTLA